MIEFTFENFLDKIKNEEPFSFSRFGDGEWRAIFNKKGHNCDGHEYFPDMGEALRNILIDNPKYHIGLQNLAMRLFEDAIKEFLKDKTDLIIDDFSNSDILHKASMKGKFKSFFDVLKEREVVIVGPEYLKEIDFIDYTDFITIPIKNCWEEVDSILNKINIAIQKQDNLVILFIASMPANVMIHNLYKKFGDKTTLLDIGSVLDPYVEKETRSYHRNLNIKEKNL